ncbi:MAG TPA: hypothetical protein VFY10_10040 [Dehalococcoidia bacterium]|nr:hypothetical protein [Dehalococcoidia bacterium]
MLTTVIVLLFAGLDLGFVVIALLWLSDYRAERDPTDARYHGRNRRPR